MRWIVFGTLAIILAAFVWIPVSGAQPAPDYEKILQLHLNYQDGTYSVSALEFKYGRALNLDIKSGALKGVILDTNGRELKSFSFPEPGIASGDILVPLEENSLLGYSERPASGTMVITLPYIQDMQTFSMTDSRDGSLLVFADLNPAVVQFCTDYPRDPDCLARIPPLKSAVPELNMFLVSAVIFAVSVIIAAVLAILTISRRTTAPGSEKQVVLIVDDEPDITNLIRIFLERRGCITIMAASGRECLGILRNQIPDLILLDVLMEPLDGWETLEQIKKNYGFRSIPVLMMTGKKLTVQEAKKYHICIEDYLMKPFSIDEIYSAMDNIFARKQKLKESLVLARQAGIDKEKFCEWAKLSHRVSVNKKILDILHVPQGIPMQTDLDTLDDMLVVDYINVKTRIQENRAEQLRQEINFLFRSKGFAEFNW